MSNKTVNLIYNIIKSDGHFLDEEARRKDKEKLKSTPKTLHPQHVMMALGISYQRATPQSIYDSWIFWNCSVDDIDNLPSYLKVLKATPSDFIGCGLSREMAEELESNQC